MPAESTMTREFSSDQVLSDGEIVQLKEALWSGKMIPFLGAGASSFPRDVAAEAKPPTGWALSARLAERSAYPPLQAYEHQPKDIDFAGELIDQILKAIVDNRLMSMSELDSDSKVETLRKIKEILSQVPSLVEKLTEVRRLAAQRRNNEIHIQNLPLVASWFVEKKWDRGVLKENLRKMLLGDGINPNSLHRLLAAVARSKPLVIISTNYDDLMESALDSANVPYDLVVTAMGSRSNRLASAASSAGSILYRPFGETKFRSINPQDQVAQVMASDRKLEVLRTIVFKIHGHIDRHNDENDTFVITEEDYVAFLGTLASGKSLVPKQLGTLIRQKPILYLGYSLRDWNLRVLFDLLTQHMTGQSQRRHISIARGIEPHERELWENKRTNVYGNDLNDLVQKLQAD